MFMHAVHVVYILSKLNELGKCFIWLGMFLLCSPIYYLLWKNLVECHWNRYKVINMQHEIMLGLQHSYSVPLMFWLEKYHVISSIMCLTGSSQEIFEDVKAWTLLKIVLLYFFIRTICKWKKN